MRNFNFNIISKLNFYFFYACYKLLIPIEVKEGRVNIIATELIWVISKFLKFKPFLIGSRSYYETKFGKFYITPDLISTIAVSPAFERRESDRLIKLIEEDLKNKKKVLFVDVGAYFGDYTVKIGNRFKKYKNLDIIAFEPDTYYLSDPTFNLLRKNVRLNNIKNIKLYKVGLGAKNAKKKNKVGIVTKRLDSVLDKKYLNKYENVYMKLDVDGYEKSVLMGAKLFIRNSKTLTLLVEDFVDNKIINYLENDFEFISKPSVYNSFWVKNE